MRKILGAVLGAGLLVAGPAMAEETGVRVEIRMGPEAQWPEPEKLVSALLPVGGGERQVKALRKKADAGETLTLELWGGAVPAEEIPSTLRESFPSLASAEITVSVLPASEKPALEAAPGPDGKVIRKRIIRREAPPAP